MTGNKMWQEVVCEDSNHGSAREYNYNCRGAGEVTPAGDTACPFEKVTASMFRIFVTA